MEAKFEAVTSCAGYKEGWDSDYFETMISSTVIGLYERFAGSYGGKNVGEILGREILKLREIGAYVDHPSRVVFTDALDRPIEHMYSGTIFTSLNSAPPGAELWAKQGLLPMKAAKNDYQIFRALKRAPILPRPLRVAGPGQLFCLLTLAASEDGALTGMKEFFTAIGKNIYPCYHSEAGKQKWEYQTINPFLGVSFAEAVREGATSTLNFHDDSRHCWSIRVVESKIPVTLGCYHEEIKSLLYARSLPMTASGRKRPILHLVSAHRRRMKEGIEIEIAEFLRGVRKVEMGGAIFDVSEPASKRETLARKAA